MLSLADRVAELREALKGRYDLGDEVGRGGMAAVYAARVAGGGPMVAIKVLYPELSFGSGAARFLREIRLSGQLDHPNILPVLESGEACGLLYFTMPFASGDSLRARLARPRRRMPLAQTVAILRDVAAGVDYAHEHNVVHRDIKPENIVFDGARALVCDFGIARALVAAGDPMISSSGLVIGTAHYISPEQASGERDIDGAVDIYALGCVAYEMLAGEPPFSGATRNAILARHVSDPPPRLRTVRPDVPECVELAIRAALAKRPEDRPASGAELVQRFDG